MKDKINLIGRWRNLCYNAVLRISNKKSLNFLPRKLFLVSTFINLSNRMVACADFTIVNSSRSKVKSARRLTGWLIEKEDEVTSSEERSNTLHQWKKSLVVPNMKIASKAGP